MARTLQVAQHDECGVLLTLGYSNGVHVPLCWEPGCWATIRASSEPTSNCGPLAYRGAVAPTGDAELRIRYDAGAPYCVGGVALGGEGAGDRGCANWPCTDTVQWAFTQDPFGLRFEGPVCGVRPGTDPYAKPLVDPPLGDRAHDTRVLGGKVVRPPARPVVPKMGGVVLAKGIGLGGRRYRDLLADDATPRTGGLSAIDLPPPPRHHDAGRGGLLPVLVAVAVVVAAVAAALRLRRPHPHGAH